MQNILILGAGKIGSLIASFLGGSGDYSVHIGDVSQEACVQIGATHAGQKVGTVVLDATKTSFLKDYCETQKPDAVISSLPYYCNPSVAEVARDCGMHYFDLTEDVEVTNRVKAMAEGSDHAFVPQCGLAPAGAHCGRRSRPYGIGPPGDSRTPNCCRHSLACDRT